MPWALLAGISPWAVGLVSEITARGSGTRIVGRGLTGDH